MQNETIVAIATPAGRGGVGIIRISGPNAYAIGLALNGHKTLLPRQATFCSFYQKNTCTAEDLVDQGLMIYFKAPHSFTGEDVLEIQAHGSPVVLDLLVRACLLEGARLANPGEFSERAFLNDKMDLTQAEAIADLIQASSQTAARMALRSLQGEFSAKIHQLNEKIIYLRLYVEAAIDFPEEEIDFIGDGKVQALLEEILNNLLDIRSKANQGVMMREGLSLVIAGRPNAGKSTLINALAGREVAIVTDVAGTTRDVMKEHILLDDIPLHILDTAGLRVTDDVVEKEGIKRAWHALKQADCVLLVIDIEHPNDYEALSAELKDVLPAEIPILTVFNKVDKFQEKNRPLIANSLCLSAQSGEGIDALKGLIKKTVGYQPNEGHFLARRRHLQALDEAQSVLLLGQQQLQEHRAGELLAEDLRLAHQILSEITGEFSSDDLLGRIFSSFCIGK